MLEISYGGTKHVNDAPFSYDTDWRFCGTCSLGSE